MAAQGLGHGAEGAAQVIERGAGLGELRSQDTDVLDNGGIARHRPLDHVREYAHHVLVEGEVADLCLWGGVDAIGAFGHGPVPAWERPAF
ncbi:hypothetical protein D9M68_992590 [compost metagenome]